MKSKLIPRGKADKMIRGTCPARANNPNGGKMKTTNSVPLALAVAACLNGASAFAAGAAADYPNRPIRMIVPNAPGSSVDTLSRIVASKLGEVLGEQMVLDNRAGAGGIIGMEIGKAATPDG